MFVDDGRFTYYQYHTKALEKRVAAFESGQAYRKMKEGMRRLRAYYERQIKMLMKELASAHAREAKNREMWFQVFQDVQAECEKRIAQEAKRLAAMEERALKAERKAEKLQDKLSEKLHEIVLARSETAEEKEKNQKLHAQLNQNFENSSLPSSQILFRGKVHNNREKTDRKPGAQPGHEGHHRKRHAVTEEPVFIPAPPEIENDPDYYRQKGEHSEIHKQVVGIRLVLTVTDYWSYVYRNRRTGAKYHPPFPENAQLEVNYDDSVKALIFLMKDHLNVPENKIREFLLEMTGGEVEVSRGMINGINAEFSSKTAQERKEIFSRLASAEVLYTDMTGARMNGSLKNIVVCTDGTDILYFFRDTKGDKALVGTPVEYFLNTLVHDHDKTFLHYGSSHQECNEHHLRYLKGAQENESNLTWHIQMRELLKEMNETREKQNRVLEPEQIAGFEKRYDEILTLAGKEYYDTPPSKYYRKGYNLFIKLRDYKEDVLFFLRHPNVDFTNNKAERGCRKPKRHQAVSGTFRGNTNHSGEEYCDAMGILQTMRAEGGNLYEKVKAVFQRIYPQKEKQGPQTC